MITPLIEKSYSKTSPVIPSILVKSGKKQDWHNKPADWSDIRKDCPKNSIALYAAHPADFSAYDNLGFTATCTGGYTVFIDGTQYGSTYASGATCSITWSTSGITTGDDITTPSTLKAHKIWITPATEGNNITAFHCARVAASGNEVQGVLWGHFNIDNTINIRNSFASYSGYYNDILYSITSKNNILKTTSSIDGIINQSADRGWNCSKYIEYLPIFNSQDTITSVDLQSRSATSNLKKISLFGNSTYKILYHSFQGSLHLEEIKTKKPMSTIDTPYNAFLGNNSLKYLPDIDYSNLIAATDFITNAVNLKDTVLDISAVTGLRKIGCHGSSQYFMNGFKGLRVSNQAPFDWSTAPQINISYTGMDRAALVQLFNDLPTVSSGQVIWITGCTGAMSLDGDDLAIANDKGWTVIGGPSLTTYYRYTHNGDNVYTTDEYIYEGDTWKQPYLTANGTLGGDTCAVATNIEQYPAPNAAAWMGFDYDGNGTITYFHSVENDTVGYFTYYSPIAINVTKITFTNQSDHRERASASGTIYGSNDNTTWTTIGTYTNNDTSALTWDIDLSSNTNYYKYYKLYSNGSISGDYWSFRFCAFTATEQPSVIYNSSFEVMSPQPTFTATNPHLINAVEVNDLVPELVDNNGVISGFISAYGSSKGNYVLVTTPDYSNTQINSFDIVFFFKTGDTINTYERIIMDSTSAEAQNTFLIRMNNGNYEFVTSPDNGVPVISSPTTNTNYGIRATYDGTTVQTYSYDFVNNTWVASNSYQPSSVQFKRNTYSAGLRAQDFYDGCVFKGSIDFPKSYIEINGVKTVLYDDNTVITINGNDYVANGTVQH